MSNLHESALPGAQRTTIIARILDQDQTLLALATQLEAAEPSGRPDLTMKQLYALAVLSACPRHVGEVAMLLGVSISSVSSLIERLVRAGLVSRQREVGDRRVVVCDITDDGQLALRHVIEIGRRRLKLLLQELSGDELATVDLAVELLIGAARTVVSRSGASVDQTLGGLPSR